MSGEGKYPIKVVSKKTGLTLHVIRAWEKRYRVVNPYRTETNRRLYTDKDIYRLTLLRKATELGYNIGNIAALPLDELEDLTEESQSLPETAPEEIPASLEYDPGIHYNNCVQAVEAFDSGRLEAAMNHASLSLSQPVLLQSVIIPLVIKIGDDWRSGKIRVMHEHLATNVIKAFLTNQRNAFRPVPQSPVVVVTTPKGQLHEIGSLITALIAASEGWRVFYLGTDLPAEEIAAACISQNAKALALSIVYPMEDPHLHQELIKLKNLLPAKIKIIVGGRGASHYKSILHKISAWSGNDLHDFRTYLEQI